MVEFLSLVSLAVNISFYDSAKLFFLLDLAVSNSLRKQLVEIEILLSKELKGSSAESKCLLVFCKSIAWEDIVVERPVLESFSLLNPAEDAKSYLEGKAFVTDHLHFLVKLCI